MKLLCNRYTILVREPSPVDPALVNLIGTAACWPMAILLHAK